MSIKQALYQMLQMTKMNFEKLLRKKSLPNPDPFQSSSKFVHRAFFGFSVLFIPPSDYYFEHLIHSSFR